MLRAWRSVSVTIVALWTSATFLSSADKPGAYTKLPADQAVAQLFDSPAPPVDWREYLRQHPLKRNIPAKNAPLDDVLEYWRYAADEPPPDADTQQRLLEVCERDPDELPDFARFFGKASIDTQERLKRIYDRTSSKHTAKAEDLARNFHDWLMKHTRYFREDFIKRVFPAEDGLRIAATENELEAFINLDRESARSHLIEQAKSADESLRISALSLLFEYFGTDADAESWRKELCAMATDRDKPTDLLEKAIFGAMKRPWPGREKWFTRLFEDRQLLHPDKPADMNALAKCVAREPDRLIALVTPLVVSANVTIRDNAVQCLVQFDNAEKARADALRPLLPWLTNKRWADDVDGFERSSLFRALTLTNLPECAPLLPKCIESETGAQLEYALDASVHYRVSDAIAPMRRRIKHERNDEYRTALMSALFHLNGLKPSEISDCLRPYVEKVADKLEEWGGSDYYSWSAVDKHGVDWHAEVGYKIASSVTGIEAAAKVVLDLAHQEEAKNPIASEHLYCLALKWPTSIRRRVLTERLQGGAFSPAWIGTVIELRHDLKQTLHEVADLKGSGQGIQAALTEDQGSIETVLKGTDSAAQTAVFACARLARVSIPLDLAVRFLDSSDQHLMQAADKYFAESDSPNARAEAKKRAVNRARVLGTQLNFSAFAMDHGAISRTEAELRAFFQRSDPPREIFALLSEGNFGNDGQRALFVYNKRNVLRCADGNGRMREREVSPAELDVLRSWIVKNDVGNLPPYDEGTMDGIQLQYVHITPDGGERVFMNNPPGGPMGAAKVQPGITERRPDPIVYSELTRRIMKLNEVPMAVVYPTLKKLEGYRVVHAKEQGEIASLRFREGELFAGVTISYDKPIEWCVVENDHLSRKFRTEPPNPLKRQLWPDYNDWDDRAANVEEGPYAGKLLWPGTRQKDNVDGLWASGRTGQPDLIARGIFYRPLVCPAGDWIVVAKTQEGEMWNAPNGVVRIHLPAKRMFPVDLPPADNFDAVAWIAAHKRVLLYRQRDLENWTTGPEKAEFHLLDPATGAHEKVEGEMRPFFDAGSHELQPTGKPNEFWAALHSSIVDPKLHTTTIGRFDSYNFRFSPVLSFPDIEFDSASLYVDGPGRQIWIAVNGDLLRVSLPN